MPACVDSYRECTTYLREAQTLTKKGGMYGNALQAASSEGHDMIVQLLLDKGAEVKAKGGHYSNALQAASI